MAQMIVELIRDKRKIVDRITHAQIDTFVSLLEKTQVSGSVDQWVSGSVGQWVSGSVG